MIETAIPEYLVYERVKGKAISSVWRGAGPVDFDPGQENYFGVTQPALADLQLEGRSGNL